MRLSLEGFAESEPRMTVDYLIAAIQPMVVQKRVVELMKLHENKVFKKDARAFKAWLCDYMRRYGEFKPTFGPAPQVPAPKPRNQDVKPDGAGKRKKKGHVAAVTKLPGRVPDSNFLTEEKVCWKCLSKDHNVFACPKAAKGEAKLLIERAREVWASAKKVTLVKTDPPAQPSEETAVKCAARVVCAVEGEVPVTVMFDSGADQSVIPPKTLKMLKAAGKEVNIPVLERPVLVKGFASPSHTVTEEATMTLKFDTDAGPLVLSHVHFWVATGDLPSGVGDMLLSRPLMVKLGYDPATMLRQVAEVAGEYDMAEDGEEQNSGLVAAVLFAVKQELKDDLAEEEEALIPLEMAACFPDMKTVDPAEKLLESKWY